MFSSSNIRSFAAASAAMLLVTGVAAAPAPLALANAGTFVDDVSQCPMLAPRAAPPANISGVYSIVVREVHEPYSRIQFSVDVRIDDIKVVMALGDSITAAFGARGSNWGVPFTQLDENRGISFASGSDAGAVSVFNFAKHFNNKAYGGSYGNHLVEVCYGQLCPVFEWSPQDVLNVALSGAKFENLDKEVNHLIDITRNNKNVDLQNDWKYLNLLIGANDVCGSCTTPTTSQQYDAYIRNVLEKVRKNIPRTIVNVISLFKVSQIWELTKRDPHCIGLRIAGLHLECTCALSLGDTLLGVHTRKIMDDQIDVWNAQLVKIVADYKNKYNDFAVIMDPGVGAADLRKFPKNYISDLDCFHPSAVAHAYVAKFVWNNLFLDSRSKVTPMDAGKAVQIYCPTENDRIQVA
ncbi:uncharacterized protein EV422DRAFT_229073 [Fimicolochytrium jonesii]|uniref:uncharacterized protein n=1 Tax=Fimicolochytrium jonesii TaxID=1396493 RepID=UPI0022FDC92F|nr:uncharacterized protein EV422DRAFT_229073 [Fimicolochytrium jonesii]KAI8817250.1 hypothetical protein EV422DRAFT_229073 [Fimicolochytrium jonesii]